jgi:hypothetical protein
MNEHVRMASIAAAVGGVLLLGDHVLSPQKPVVISTTGKQMPNAWGELSQQEVDALTSILAKLPAREVAIFCGSRDCEDMALDFDNAFESAHWISGIERPLVDTNAGINVGPDDDAGRSLAAAIESATNGRIKPGLIEARLIGDRMALVISRKR